MDGFESDPDATYRVHAPYWRHITLFGSGDANGSAGIRLSTNANGTKVGLASFEHVYVSDFETCISGESAADSSQFVNCHFRNCREGIVDMDSETVVRDSFFWHFTDDSTAPVCIRPVGDGTKIVGNEFQPGGGTGAVTTTYVIRPRNGAGKTLVSGNSFDGGYNRAIDMIAGDAGQTHILGNAIGGTANDTYTIADTTSEPNLIANNDFSGSAPTAYIRANTNDRVIGNSFVNASTASVTNGMVVVDGSNVTVAWNSFPSGAPASVDLLAGASDAYLWGVFPDGVSDSGTRTRVNGVAQEALAGAAPGTPSNWNTGDVVEDTDNAGDAYLKLPSSGFTQIAT